MQVKDVMTRAVVTCHPFDKLQDAASTLDREGVGCLPVVTSDGSQRVIGLLTDRAVALAAGRERRRLGEMMVRSAMATTVLSRVADASVSDALECMRSTGARWLPVVDRDGRLVGIVSLSDIVCRVARDTSQVYSSCRGQICRVLAAGARPVKRRGIPWRAPAAVEDVMATEVVACRIDQPLGEVARAMDKEGVACAPVMESGSGRRVVAMLTDRDIFVAAVRRAFSLDELTVADAANPTVRSCWPDDSAEAAAAIMRAYGIRRLPVVDAAFDLLGLVTLEDLARALLDRDASQDGIPACDEIVETLAAVVRAAVESRIEAATSVADFHVP